jgi:hypothetical protein
MSDVFLLGAGFSKAVSMEMPVTNELPKAVLNLYKHTAGISSEIRSLIEEDFEKALTFLATEKPWLGESENLRHRALFLDLTSCVRAVFWDMSGNPLVWGINKPWIWLEELLAYWHNNRSTVITLNYDTLVERVASAKYGENRPRIPTGQLYPMRVTPAVLEGSSIRTGSAPADEKTETFKLFKLHGSINWFYSGRSEFFGEELFYIPCNGGVDGVFDMAEGHNPDGVDSRCLSGKSPLIIPPVLDKSAFLQHEALRSMWFRAGEAIRLASGIVCLGYSLPDSDLAVTQFLKGCAPPKRVRFEIVDLNARDKLESKVEHFARFLGSDLYELRQEYSGEGCIPKFVIENCIDDPKEKRRAAGEALVSRRAQE